MLARLLLPLAVFISLSAARPAAAGLPLTEIPAAGRGDTLAVIYSGDGGWAPLDRGVAAQLTRAGTPVLGINSLRYFLVRKSPQQAADDLAATLRDHMRRWGRSRVILAGYSFGADALPAIVPRLPADLRGRIRLVALMGVGPSGDLKFQPGEWMGRVTAQGYAMAPAVAELRGLPVICIYGAADGGAACPTLPVAQPVRLEGGHHFAGAYDQLGAVIVRAAGL